MSDRLVSYDPTTLEPVGDVALTSPGDVAVAVERSRKAFDGWRSPVHAERRTRLRDFKRTVLDRGEEVARVVSSETGKPVEDAYAFDVMTSLTLMDHYQRNAERYLRPQRRRSWPFVSTRGWTEYHPRGVVGVISPWNYPFFLSMIPTFTALAAGCSVVLKPSEKTPLTGELLGELAADSGLPADLVQVVHGAGEVGQAVVETVDVVAFTGSTAVGRSVAEAAGRRLIPAVLELGGKDPIVVLDDADLARTARGAVWSGLLNAGQTCVAVERAYVVDAVYDRFLPEVERAMDDVAAATHDRRDIGPMIDESQLATVEDHVADAVAKGATVVRGGTRVAGAAGYYFEPTLLTDVHHGMRIMQEETFGPVLCLTRVSDEEEALSHANDVGYGLHASVWGGRRHAADVASRIEAGTVAVNDVDVNFIMPTLPFGGVGDSGLGVAFGPEGIRSYCYPKGITSARLPVSTSALLGARFPRRRGLRYWKALARTLFRW